MRNKQKSLYTYKFKQNFKNKKINKIKLKNKLIYFKIFKKKLIRFNELYIKKINKQKIFFLVKKKNFLFINFFIHSFYNKLINILNILFLITLHKQLNLDSDINILIKIKLVNLKFNIYFSDLINKLINTKKGLNLNVNFLDKFNRSFTKTLQNLNKNILKYFLFKFCNVFVNERLNLSKKLTFKFKPFKFNDIKRLFTSYKHLFQNCKHKNLKKINNYKIKKNLHKLKLLKTKRIKKLSLKTIIQLKKNPFFYTDLYFNSKQQLYNIIKIFSKFSTILKHKLFHNHYKFYFLEFYANFFNFKFLFSTIYKKNSYFSLYYGRFTFFIPQSYLLSYISYKIYLLNTLAFTIKNFYFFLFNYSDYIQRLKFNENLKLINKNLQLNKKKKYNLIKNLKINFKNSLKKTKKITNLKKNKKFKNLKLKKFTYQFKNNFKLIKLSISKTKLNITDHKPIITSENNNEINQKFINNLDIKKNLNFNYYFPHLNLNKSKTENLNKKKQITKFKNKIKKNFEMKQKSIEIINSFVKPN